MRSLKFWITLALLHTHRLADVQAHQLDIPLPSCPWLETPTVQGHVTDQGKTVITLKGKATFICFFPLISLFVKIT